MKTIIRTLFMLLLIACPQLIHAMDNSNEARESEINALIKTAGEGDVGFMELLLRAYFFKGAHVHNKKGLTPLAFAAHHGYTKACQLLLAHGARPESILIDGTLGLTPLMYAADKSHIDTCKLLLEHNALINAQTSEGFSALAAAADGGNAKICNFLLDHGADLMVQITDGKTPLIFAAIRHHEEITKLFIQHQKKIEQSMYCLLFCLKNHEQSSGQLLYKLSKDVLKPYLKKFTLKALLDAQYEGRTAYSYYPADWLKLPK